MITKCFIALAAIWADSRDNIEDEDNPDDLEKWEYQVRPGLTQSGVYKCHSTPFNSPNTEHCPTMTQAEFQEIIDKTNEFYGKAGVQFVVNWHGNLRANFDSLSDNDELDKSELEEFHLQYNTNATPTKIKVFILNDFESNQVGGRAVRNFNIVFINTGVSNSSSYPYDLVLSHEIGHTKYRLKHIDDPNAIKREFPQNIEDATNLMKYDIDLSADKLHNKSLKRYQWIRF